MATNNTSICSSYDHIVKMVMIGDAGVGKSSLLLRFSEGIYDPSYISTIGVDFHISTLEHNGKVVKAHIWDTAGQERFKTITRNYYRGADAIIICFDTTDRDSFQNVQNWLTEVNKNCSDDKRERLSLLLVGTKADLVVKKAVSCQEATQFAEAHGLTYVQTSAKNNQAVDDTFQTLVADIVDKREKYNTITQTEKKTVHLDATRVPTKKRGCFQFLFGK
eukprot:TRINITY_DN65601_c0_g2_i1.p1 TRINITY_DN65601_c0_g2~~TRINITY_DN65601_c0_g2_i1.p1  ORF type:complete len:220 (+),score=27.48 TRINITY_DN65601_c0_g2_i1:97-756(+)